MSYCLRILAAGCMGAGVTLAYPAFAQNQDQQPQQVQGKSAGSYQGKRPTGGFHPTAGTSSSTSQTGGGTGRGKHEADIE
jgi:hypothetical protein